MADIQPYLQGMVERTSDPDVQASLSGFEKTLLFRFTDTGEEWAVRFAEGQRATLSKETPDDPDLVVTTTTDVLAGVMRQEINGMTAYMQKKIQAEGPIEDLMRLQQLMA